MEVKFHNEIWSENPLFDLCPNCKKPMWMAEDLSFITIDGKDYVVHTKCNAGSEKERTVKEANKA